MRRSLSIIPRRIACPFLTIAVGLSVFFTLLLSISGAQDTPARAKSTAPAVFQEHEAGKLRNSVGKEIIVQGRVATTSSSSSGHQFLNFPSGAIRVICFKEDLRNFTDGGPAVIYKGKSIALTGLLTKRGNDLQIQLKSPKQISVAGAKPDRPGRAPFVLKETSPGVFVTPAGLRFAGLDPEGRTRIEHVMRHAKDEPGRAGSHGVFEKGSQDDVLALIDEAWMLARKRGIKPAKEGNSLAYSIPMGRKIGYLGGTEGTRRRKPALTRLFLVIRSGSTDVITAFPK
ncbi:MAG: OB-fold nucleic acid binding domain-containing protein [Verrucomicrobiae bacterium]|nr:OB-fold nucleic acid binding domain-containing protein [Verrucomicrobiae bacterium]